MASGLKVNFEKCCLLGVNIRESKLRDMAEVLECGVGTFPFSYLDIKVGMNHRHTTEWSGEIQKIRNHVKRWEDKKISLGGRIILVNAVLSSLPTYHLSFYPFPNETLRDVRKIQSKFLWGWGVVRVIQKLLG
ncbi:hypothetical protein ACS0TY_008279 [Phlomoides rotata]